MDLLKDCICGKGGKCFTNNYDIVGDGVARAKTKELAKCDRFVSSVKALIAADLVKRGDGTDEV